MDQSLQGLDGVICYLEDILVSGKTEAEHLENQQTVLSRFQKHGVQVKKSKCSIVDIILMQLVSIIPPIVVVSTPKKMMELRSFLNYGSGSRSVVKPLRQLNRRLCLPMC